MLIRVALLGHIVYQWSTNLELLMCLETETANNEGSAFDSEYPFSRSLFLGLWPY